MMCPENLFSTLAFSSKSPSPWHSLEIFMYLIVVFVQGLLFFQWFILVVIWISLYSNCPTFGYGKHSGLLCFFLTQPGVIISSFFFPAPPPESVISGEHSSLSPSLRKCIHQIDLQASMWGIFLITGGCGRAQSTPPHCGWGHPRPGSSGLCEMASWANHRRYTGRPVFPHGLCFSYCLQVPAPMSLPVAVKR